MECIPKYPFWISKYLLTSTSLKRCQLSEGSEVFHKKLAVLLPQAPYILWGPKLMPPAHRCLLSVLYHPKSVQRYRLRTVIQIVPLLCVAYSIPGTRLYVAQGPSYPFWTNRNVDHLRSDLGPIVTKHPVFSFLHIPIIVILTPTPEWAQMALSKVVFYSEMTMPFGQNLTSTLPTLTFHTCCISCIKKQLLRSHGKVFQSMYRDMVHKTIWSGRQINVSQPAFRVFFAFLFHPPTNRLLKHVFPNSSPQEILIPQI